MKRDAQEVRTQTPLTLDNVQSQVELDEHGFPTCFASNLGILTRSSSVASFAGSDVVRATPRTLRNVEVIDMPVNPFAKRRKAEAKDTKTDIAVAKSKDIAITHFETFHIAFMRIRLSYVFHFVYANPKRW